ncbi:MAG: hypothetical protein ACJA0Q_000075 [Saprospiraceae bacterium]|jgi:hypothetical protein
MLPVLFKSGALLLLLGLYSCSDNTLDKSSLAIIAVENIQLSFDLISDNAVDYKNLADSKGNMFEIKDLPQLLTYVKSNNQELLLSSDFEFLWDTLYLSKKLYLIDHNKKHQLIIQSIDKSKDSANNNLLELNLTPKSKVNLSRFFVDNIGKGLVLVDKNGFVVSAESISRLDNGNLSIEKP